MILIYMEKLVDIKIRKEYRDILKQYCKDNGLKMYALVEQLIKKNCLLEKPTNVLRSQPSKKLISGKWKLETENDLYYTKPLTYQIEAKITYDITNYC